MRPSHRFIWDVHIVFGFSGGVGVPSSCRQSLESAPMAMGGETGWGPAWVPLSWTRLKGANHASEGLKCYKEGDSSPLAVPPCSQQLDTNKLFWKRFLMPLCLLRAARHPCWSPGLTYGEGRRAVELTVCVVVCSRWREAAWQRLETTLWLLGPVLRPQGALSSLGVHRSSVLRGSVLGHCPCVEC